MFLFFATRALSDSGLVSYPRGESFFPFLSIGVTIQERRRTRRSLELERDKKKRKIDGHVCKAVEKPVGKKN
jgi:hypothetical protein